MPVRAQPFIYTFAEGDTFDRQGDLDRLNYNFLTLAAKFGSIVADDLSTATDITLNGPLDVRSHGLTNVKENMGVINIEEAGTNLVALMTNMSSGGIILIPPHYESTITDTVVFRSNVQIVGGGFSSIVTASGSDFDMFECSVPNCGIFNLLIDGGGTGRSTGNAIYLHDNTSLRFTAENVAIGPLSGGSQDDAAPESAIRIQDAGEVRVHGCYLRRHPDYGILVTSTGTRNLSVDIIENHIEGCDIGGIKVSDADGIFIGKNTVFNNGGTGITQLECGEVICWENRIANSTSNIGYQITSDPADKCTSVIMNNAFIDDKSVTASFTHLSIGADSSSIVVYGNWFGPSDSGRIDITAFDGVIARDGNHLHVDGAYYVPSWIDYNGVAETGWFILPGGNSKDTFDWRSPVFGNNQGTEEPVSNYDQRVHEKAWDGELPIAGGRPSVILPAFPAGGASCITNASWLIDIGSTNDDDKDFEVLDMRGIFERMSTPGSVMMPNFLHWAATPVAGEVGSVTATLNVVEQKSHMVKNEFTGAPHRPLIFCDHWPTFRGTGGATSADQFDGISKCVPVFGFDSTRQNVLWMSPSTHMKKAAGPDATQTCPYGIPTWVSIRV